ncbi:MAG: glycerol kinase GlpK, partial [Clostridia bacterium]|nr:glycerol kinase GlpK [Clostridia bacterium]
AQRGELLFGTVDTFILWQLSKGKIFATDYTNASRTMLFNIHTLTWDKELLRLFDIPKSMLPKVYPSSHRYGETDAGLFGSPVHVCGVVGDQQAALFGQLCTGEGDVKNTYGTGCFLLMNTGGNAVKSRNGLVTTLGATTAAKSPQYVLEGSVFVGGAVVQWLRDELKIIASAEESEAHALSVKNSGGVYVVPAFTGLGAPYWDAAARGTICGITRGTTRAHIIRAALEAIAYQVCELVTAMQKDANIHISHLSVDGGASQNGFLMQFQSDILGCNVVRPRVTETTALGAAYLAGLCSGFWKDEEELKKINAPEKVYSPDMPELTRFELLNGWQNAVKKTLS